MADTSWVIDYMNGVPEIVERFDELSPQGIGLSIISLAELYDGVFGARDPQIADRGLRKFLDNVDEIVPLSEPVCLEFAKERVRLRRSGTALKTLIF